MKLGIASFAIAVRTHGEGGEGSALAAVLFSSLAEGRDIASAVEFCCVVVARAKPLLTLVFRCVKYLFPNFCLNI